MDSVEIAIEMITGTSNNTAYAPRAIALALQDIALLCHNVVYVGNVIGNDCKLI